MSLLKMLSDGFSPTILKRGRDYFDQGRVTIVDADDSKIAARVRGTSLYNVQIDTSTPGEIRVDCECPYSADRGLCKHIWAALLKADEQKLLPEGDALVEFMDDRDGPSDLDDDYDDDAVEQTPEEKRVLDALLGVAKRRPAPGADVHQPKQPPWKRHLALVREHMMFNSGADTPQRTWPENKRIVYLIDVPDAEHGTGHASVHLATSIQDRSGRWGPPKAARITESQVRALPDAQDRMILRMLGGTPSDEQYYDPHLGQDYPILAADSELVLKPICATGRCFVRTGGAYQKHVDPDPLVWDDGPPWELHLEMATDPSNERYVVDASLRRGDQRVHCREPRLVLGDGLVILRGTIARMEHFGAFALLNFLRTHEGGFSLATQQADEMLGELLSLPALPRLDLPETLKVTTIRVPMRPRLHIAPPPKRSYYDDDKLVGHLSFDYDGRIIPENGDAPRFDPATRTLLQRDLPAEAAAAALLDELKFKEVWNYGPSGRSRRLAPSKLNRLVLRLCAEGWQVEAEGKLYRRAGELNVQVSSGIDWFELDGSVDFGGASARLPRLLAALRRGEKTVMLDDGTVGVLADEWLQRYGLLARVAGDSDGDTLRFSRGQVGLLDALVSNLPQASCDEVFQQAREQLRRFEGVEACDPPPEFIGTLRPYQRQGLGWLNFLRTFKFGGCLADDMGLGKTIQVLALLQARRQPNRTSLVVVPRSLIFNWVEEARRFTPELRVLDHSGITRAKTCESYGEYDMILTTYGTLRLDAPFLKDFRFDYAILDEAQAIKNASSESAKAARLVQADHRLALSGTPIQNHMGELWSLFEFLNPGMLGSASIFKTTGAGSAQIEREGRELLSKALRPFILRRTKAQVAPDLPEKTEQTIWCDLEPEQRKLYDELREHYRASLLDRIATEGINKAKIQILEALLRLRQAACHPGLIDKSRIGHSSAKLDSLLPQLEELMEEDHKVLVFSQFTSMLAIVKKHLDKRKLTYEYLDGQTRDRQANVDRFQNDPKCKLFLISLKAGGLGLNLTAAEYVYLLDPWWNPAVESQAIDRAHRIGQTRRVFAYRLIARGTVEEKVLELQSRKKDLADMIINADNSLIGKLGREDLELLLS